MQDHNGWLLAKKKGVCVVCFIAHQKAGDKGAGKGSQKDFRQFKGLARGPGWNYNAVLNAWSVDSRRWTASEPWWWAL